MNALKPAGRALEGSKALVIGVANEHSIAWGCAKAFHELGAQVALTYLNEKAKAWVEPLAQSTGAPMLMNESGGNKINDIASLPKIQEHSDLLQNHFGVLLRKEAP